MSPLAPVTPPTGSPGAGPAPRLSLLIPARNAGDTIERTVREAHRALSALCPEDFEIVVIPNPKPGDPSDPTEAVIRKLASSLSGIVVAPHSLPPGKGAALRTGFWASRGRSLFFTDADLPYDLEFIARALPLVENENDLVTGNRRLADSEFNVPVDLLPLAYGRHRLGLLFNRFMRLILPIATTDTQAGIKGMSRKLAERAFTRQICPGFFFDLEIFLAAAQSGARRSELPITLHLNSEKSTIWLMKEAVLTVFWIFRIRLRLRQGGYR